MVWWLVILARRLVFYLKVDESLRVIITNYWTWFPMDKKVKIVLDADNFIKRVNAQNSKLPNVDFNTVVCTKIWVIKSTCKLRFTYWTIKVTDNDSSEDGSFFLLWCGPIQLKHFYKCVFCGSIRFCKSVSLQSYVNVQLSYEIYNKGGRH